MEFPFQSKHWFWPVMLVLIVGYAIGGILPVVLHFYGFLHDQIPEGFRPVLFSFMIGLLGANVQLSIAFARDVNAVMGNGAASLPSCFDCFGYLLKQIWGGIAAVFFVLATKLGFLAAVASSDSTLRLPAIVVISFCAGLRAFQILKMLAGVVPIKPAGSG
jgi:hypothetical protein